jgi:hypothetical protein
MHCMRGRHDSPHFYQLPCMRVSRVCLCMYVCTHARTHTHILQGVLTIAFTELVLEDRPLASGSFKRVYKATWAQRGNGDAQQVAVLVLRQGDSAADEINIFDRLGRHPHLVKLLAVSTRPPAGDMCMVLEFAQRGSLDGVLHELSGNGESPTNAVLLTAAGQVCVSPCFGGLCAAVFVCLE